MRFKKSYRKKTLVIKEDFNVKIGKEEMIIWGDEISRKSKDKTIYTIHRRKDIS